MRLFAIMDLLTAFGLCSLTAMLVCFALQDRSPRFVLGLAGACGLASLDAVLQGLWPFGVIAAIWALVALWRFRRRCSVSLANR
jgi:hypothetical protein